MSDYISALKQLQEPRPNSNENMVMFAQPRKALTIPQFIEEEARKAGLGPEDLKDKNTVLSLFDEQDVFVKSEMMGRGENRHPQLVQYKQLVTQFYYDDFHQFVERVVFQSGFAEKFNILVLARVDFSSLEPVITKKGKK